jgi:hypothetical protein
MERGRAGSCIVLASRPGTRSSEGPTARPVLRGLAAIEDVAESYCRSFCDVLEADQFPALSQLLSHPSSSYESHPPRRYALVDEMVTAQSRLQYSQGEAHELNERHNSSLRLRIRRGTYLGMSVLLESK